MSDQSEGEHSKRSEPSEDEKPFKKARYVWEVKGKYHLKDNYQNNNTINKNNNTQAEESVNIKERLEDEKADEVQPDISNESARAQKRKCCLDSFIVHTDAILDSDEDTDNLPGMPEDCNYHDEIPAPESTVPINQDYYFQKWQARQIARGFVDNTINTVLETWANHSFDAAEIVENCASDGQVEDDAILMAIQSHGLQSNTRGNSTFSNSGTEMEEASACGPDMERFALDNIKNYQNEQRMVSSASNGDSMSCDSSISNLGEVGNLDMADPMDFLNTAVSVAIQKKGLSYGY